MPTLQFKGKSFVSNHHLAVKYHQLLPNAAASLTDKISLTDNLIIHGDNLIALKALLPNYAGRVKCIYIDPPYNTGNEGWRYNDNVNSPMIQEWLRSRQPVDREDLTRHDKWLCMMMPRLNLLRELLREDGVIFVSIDDNEVQHLRMLMDEIFGADNFLVTFVWQAKDTRGNDSNDVATTHNYVLCFRRSDKFQINLLTRTEEQIANYKNPDDDPRGPWLSIPLTRSEYRSRDYYPLVNPAGEEVLPPVGSSWRRPRETIDQYQRENRLWWGKEGRSTFPSIKRFLSEVKVGVVPITWWDYRFAGSTRHARAELKELFATDRAFDTPKPVSLVRRILELATGPDEEDIVLDSFAGSGTTGQAVLQLNQEDGGNRRFILVETEDYADTLTAERLRRVIQGVPAAKDERLRVGLGGSFSFFELGAPLDIAGVLAGTELPGYEDLARYLFYTATGEEFDPALLDEAQSFVGESTQYRVYLLYQPAVEYLKQAALTLERIQALPDDGSKQRLVFAPTRFVDSSYLETYNVKYAQLPFEIYRFHY